MVLEFLRRPKTETHELPMGHQENPVLDLLTVSAVALLSLSLSFWVYEGRQAKRVLHEQLFAERRIVCAYLTYFTRQRRRDKRDAVGLVCRIINFRGVICAP